MSDRFKFEGEEGDFPFYNDNPALSKVKWILACLGFIIFAVFTLVDFIHIPKIATAFIALGFPILAFIYIFKGNFGLVIKKIKKRDIKLIFIILVLSYIYSLAIPLILNFIFGATFSSNPVVTQLNSLIFWIIFPIQMFTEELVKFFAFLVVLYLIYKFSQNRKLSIVIATFAAAMIFGFVHLTTYGNLLQVILLQGFGSIFDIYAYLKTKNIVVPYIIHLLFDLIAFLLLLAGNAM